MPEIYQHTKRHWLGGIEEFTGTDIDGVYKYPPDCEEKDCKYHVEWSNGETADEVNFVIIARNTSGLNVGLASTVDKV